MEESKVNGENESKINVFFYGESYTKIPFQETEK